MAKYLDDSQQSEKPIKISANEARQGYLDQPVLIVLLTSLALVVLAWGAVELWSRYISPPERVDPVITSTLSQDTGKGSRQQ